MTSSSVSGTRQRPESLVTCHVFLGRTSFHQILCHSQSRENGRCYCLKTSQLRELWKTRTRYVDYSRSNCYQNNLTRFYKKAKHVLRNSIPKLCVLSSDRKKLKINGENAIFTHRESALAKINFLRSCLRWVFGIISPPAHQSPAGRKDRIFSTAVSSESLLKVRIMWQEMICYLAVEEESNYQCAEFKN